MKAIPQDAWDHFKSLGFPLPPAVQVFSPTCWTHHPRIWAKCIRVAGVAGPYRIQLYVPNYRSPPSRLRQGYFEPHHDIYFDQPAWYGRAVNWLRGTGKRHADAAHTEQIARDARLEASSQLFRAYRNELAQGTDDREVLGAVVLENADMQGVSRPCGVIVTLRLRGSPVEVLRQWRRIKAVL